MLWHSGTCFPGPGRPRDPPLPTHVLAERVLLTCPLSQRYYCPSTTYDVEVPDNIIFLRPDTATGLASLARRHYFCARLRSPAVSCGLPYCLSDAVWITCTAVSANGRPRAPSNPSEPLHVPLALSAALPANTTQRTRAAVIVDHRATVHHSLLLNPNRLASLSPPPLPLFFSSRPPTSPSSHCSDSALTTLDRPAQARMLTALSIEQYSFSIFTTLLYRPPCGIALDVYNYS